MNWIWSRGGSASKKRTRAVLTRSESDIESKFIQSDIHDVVNPLTWNKLPEIVRKSLPKWKDDLFSQSEQLRLRTAAQSSTSASSPTTPQGGTHSPKSPFGGQHRPPGTLEYTVEEGDTLNTVALKFDMTPSQLAQLNRYGFNTIVHPGMILYVLDPDQPVPVKPVARPGETNGGLDPPPVLSTNTSENFIEELSMSHMQFKAKYLTKDVGCARGFILLNAQSLVFKPFDDDPLVREKSPAQYEVVLFLQDVVYAAISAQLEGLPPGAAAAVSPMSPAASVLSSIRPPHPLPGRAVRDTSPHPTHEDSFTLDRQQPVAGTLDISHSDECHQSEDCDVDSPPMDDPFTDDLPDDKAAADQPANPLLPDYPVLLLKNLYPKPASKRSPRSRSAVASPDERTDGSEPLAVSVEGEEVFGDGEGSRPLTGSEGKGQGVQVDRADSGGPQNTDRSTALLQSAVEGRLMPCSSSLPKFLHICVSCKDNPSFTPMVHGVCIPGQHFRGDFWFAIPDDKVHHLIQFFLHHHPHVKLNSRHEWVGGKFVMVDIDRDNELTVASDHFGGSSEQWEVLSFKDFIRKEPLSMQVEKDLPLPALSEESHLMSNSLLGSLAEHMILRGVGLPWELGYSTFRDGISLHTLYRRLGDYEDCPNVLVVKDEAGTVFGGVLSYPLKRSERYFGDGESFLFSCQGDECKIYHWSGLNDFFIKGDKDSFMLGGGDGQCGLWVDEYLNHGSSSPCQTFENECLATQRDFVILGMEVWCLVS